MLNTEFDSLFQIPLTRRNFLVAIGLTASALALGSAIDDPESEYRNNLIPLATIANLDFVSRTSTPGHVRYSYIETLTQIKEMLGRDYNIPVGRVLYEFGPDAYTENVFKREVTSVYPAYGLVAGAMLSFASHGEGVVDCQDAFSRKYGYDFIPQVFPVQPGLTIKDLQYKDTLGNPSVLIHMSAEPLKETLRGLPELPIVNLSLQLGTVAITHKRKKLYTSLDENYETLQQSLLTSYKLPDISQYLFYDPSLYFIDEDAELPQVKNINTGELLTIDTAGYTLVAEEDYDNYTTERKKEILDQTFHLSTVETSPYYEIQGAYTSEFGKENIQELFSLVNEFPDKLFFVAAGNYGDDLRPLREHFADVWPQNLVIQGYWEGAIQYPRMFSTYDTFGADIYVDSQECCGDIGSSMSTGVLSVAAGILHSRGYAIADIKDLLFSFCDEVEIETKPAVPFGSTNVEDYITAELHRKKEPVKVFNQETFSTFLLQPVV